MKHKYPSYLPLFLSLTLLFPTTAYAVPPPDFIFNIGSQLAYFFSFIAVFLSATFGVLYQYLRVKYHAAKVKPLKFVLVLVAIASLSIGTAYFYERYAQQKAYEQWLAEVQEQTELGEDDPLDSPEIETPTEVEAPSFFTLHKDEPLSITNEAFQALLNSGTTDYVVLDARENLENSYGHFPGSIHIRYADLLEGKTDELPTDEYVYVLCWSGMRGKEVAELLRSYGYVAIYLQDGVDGWVSDFGGVWEGSIKFSSIYPDQWYALTFTTDETRRKVSEGVVLVDAREPEKIEASSIEAYDMPIMYTPSDELEAMYAQVPAGSQVITICDEYINCFMAKLVGVELEIRGSDFLGRYNRPWEY